jgi:hypothetical protein
MIPAREAGGSAMMGRQDRDQGQLFYEFCRSTSQLPAFSVVQRKLFCSSLHKNHGRTER